MSPDSDKTASDKPRAIQLATKPLLVVSIEVIQDVHVFMRDTNKINHALMDEVKDKVRALREAVIALANIRTMFANTRLFG